MHEHKQNQCKRKVKHRKNVMGLIIFCITVGIAFMFTYYQNLRKEISVRQKWLETVLTGEKKWILENQGPEGEIYMNGSKAGDVNPYFACMAALGLLAETKNCPMTETEQKAVGRYLDWHTGVLLETDVSFSYGKISGKDRNYRPAGILEKRNQPCIKKDSKPDAGWNYTGFRRKHNSLSDG